MIRVKGQGSRVKTLPLYALLFFLLATTGCTHTYHKEKFNESIIRVCKNEYKIDVKVDTVGKTIAIYLPLKDLLDFNFSITKDAAEKINDVILSVSRVALSSDAKFDFYCIIAHDIQIPEIQIIIIKSVDDVKRFLLNDISRTDYSKRMLVDMRMSPQAQKEQSIKEVFEKMHLDRRWQEQVLNEFFRSEPAGLGEIGYWNDHFYIKDISLAEFLAEQIASRVRMEFREDKNLLDLFLLKSVKGYYSSRPARRYFALEISAQPTGLNEPYDRENLKNIFRTTLNIASGVIHSYRFKDFDYLAALYQNDGTTLKVSREDLEAFRKKKIEFEDILSNKL